MPKMLLKQIFPLFRKHKKDIYKQIIKTGEFVYQIGESDNLRRKSRPVSISKIKTKEFRAKVNYLKKCLLKYRRITGKGRGISAVQVGIAEAFSVIYCHSEFISESQNYKTEILNSPKGINTTRVLPSSKGRHFMVAQVQDDGDRVRDDVDKHPIDKNGLLVIINPKITKKSAKLLKYPEMCMSAAPIIAEVIRPAWIGFEYYDEKGIKRFWKIKDNSKNNRIYNRVFQHEIDHINGIINIDRVDSKELKFQLDPKFYGKAEFKKI